MVPAGSAGTVSGGAVAVADGASLVVRTSQPQSAKAEQPMMRKVLIAFEAAYSFIARVGTTMKVLLFLPGAVVAFLIGCGTPPPAMVKFPVVLDTVRTSLKPRIQTSWYSTAAEYSPLYLGLPADTLGLDPLLGLKASRDQGGYGVNEPRPPAHPADGCFIHWRDEKEYRKADSASLSVVIDTAQRILHQCPMFHNALDTPYWVHPVMLTNLIADTVAIGYGDHLRLIMEARTDTGGWAPIEEPFGYMCGVGIGDIVLPPGYIAITGALIRDGELRTECRLKCGGAYSNTFYADLDPAVFEHMNGTTEPAEKKETWHPRLRQ